MKKVLIIGGSKGIGKAIINEMNSSYEIINISRSEPENLKTNIVHYSCDFEINVLGAVRVIQKYLKVLKAGTDPSVVLFSTVAVKMGMPFHASIAVAKAGVEALVKSLGAELAAQVRFNAIAPTITETGLADKLLRNDMVKEKMRERHPMKNYLQPEDVAAMAEFLVSEKSKRMSGQIIEMDCGIVSFKL